MPHLHLPMDHTDADLVLAANLAEIVGSEDLYVAWSHGSGAGAVPQVQAVVQRERELSPMAEVLGAVAAGMAAFWRALMGRPDPATPATPTADAPRETPERPYADS